LRLFANSAIVFSKLSLAVDCSNSGGAEDKLVEREAEEKASAEEEVMVAGEGRAGSHPAQEAMERERIDCPAPTGGSEEVGDSAVPTNMHPTLPQLPG